MTIVTASRAVVRRGPRHDPLIKRRGLKTRLTNRTIHQLASLDQTKEGPVEISRKGRGLQYSAGKTGVGGPVNRFATVDPAPY